MVDLVEGIEYWRECRSRCGPTSWQYRDYTAAMRRAANQIITEEVQVSEKRIIDRDIEFYTADVENRERRLRTCPPSEEHECEVLMNAAKVVLKSLIAYRNAMDAIKEQS